VPVGSRDALLEVTAQKMCWKRGVTMLVVRNRRRKAYIMHERNERSDYDETQYRDGRGPPCSYAP